VARTDGAQRHFHRRRRGQTIAFRSRRFVVCQCALDARSSGGDFAMTATLEVITQEEITIPKLHEVYTRAFMHPETQTDGSLKLELEGLKLFVKVQPEKKILSLYALFGVKAGTPRLQVLELCNRINDGLVMVRACSPSVFPSPALWLDHDLDIEFGMTADDIVSETRRFRTVIAGVPGMDTEDVLT
jgi:hypothetical protein